MKFMHMVSFVLVVVGALNWGLVGFFDYNLVSTVLGGIGSLEKLVYILVGISAVYVALTHPKDCKVCSKK